MIRLAVVRTAALPIRLHFHFSIPSRFRETHSFTLHSARLTASLRTPDHGRWFSDGLNPDAGMTEFCWMPRGDEVHFICEELPSVRSGSTRASRYLHAVYCHESKMIAHLDGALRVYTDTELQERMSQHLRNAGKQGTRVKIFRTDASVPRECFSLVAQAFFVWNRDVVDYFKEAIAA